MCFTQVFQSYLVERIDLMKYIRTVITFSCFVLGDPAIGKGVNRFIFSMTTQKLKCGFHLNLGIPTLHQCPSQQCLHLVSFSVLPQKILFSCFSGNAHITKIFDGEPDHLVPSSSAHLVDSDLFLMAGRMIGHCFLHGDPPLSGLSPAVVHVISGGSAETDVRLSRF